MQNKSVSSLGVHHSSFVTPALCDVQCLLGGRLVLLSKQHCNLQAARSCNAKQLAKFQKGVQRFATCLVPDNCSTDFSAVGFGGTGVRPCRCASRSASLS